jgi:hypothetical protein
MRPITFLLLVYALIIGVHSAHAMGKKLDLSQIQGTYTTDVDGKNALLCPENITVVYDAQKATLDSDAFHFSAIDQGSKTTGQDATPDESEFQNDWVKTSSNSDSVSEEKVSQNISGNIPIQETFPQGPFDSSVPVINGQPVIPQIVSDHNSTIRTTIKFDEKSKTFVKTVMMDDLVDDSQTCTYQKN